MRDQQLFMAYHAPWGEVDEKNVSLFPIKTEWQNMEQKRISLVISDDIHRVCPDFVGAALWAEVSNGSSASGLLQEMEEAERQLQERMDTERLKALPSIAATRAAYRACGKDPSRYRPAGEQLARRVIKGAGLYRIDALVDAVNLASLVSGYSIGGLDADKIQGGFLTLGIGREQEPYEGIGRGVLNIAGMPVYRDEAGGVATPTSDHMRTRITGTTRHLLALVNGYDGNRDAVVATARYLEELLRRYAGCRQSEIWTYVWNG